MRRLLAVALALSMGASALADTPERPAHVATTAPPSDTAPSPESLRAAREMFDAMDYRQAVDDQFSALMPPLIAAELRHYRNLSEAQRTAIQDSIVEAVRALEPEMIDIMAVAYARTFSIEDLHAIRDFYRTPAGRRLVTTTRSIEEQSQRLIIQLMPRFQQEMTASLCRRLDCQALARARQS